MTQLPIPVHVGSETLDRWDEIEAMQRKAGDDAAPYLRDQRRPSVADPDLDWTGLGFDPRRIGSDTADCAAALRPGIFSNDGGDEFARFKQGAAARDERALAISPIGELEEESVRGVYQSSVFGPADSTVHVGQPSSFTTVRGRLLGKEAKVHDADDLTGSDIHLARWFLSCSPAPRRAGAASH